MAATLFTMTGGWIVVGLAAWCHRPPLRTIVILGGVLAAVSALAPLALEAGLPARLTLAGLHVVVDAFLIRGIARLRRAARSAIR